MKILALEKEITGVSLEKFKAYSQKEALKVWEYYKGGIIREIYFSKYDHTAVIIMECKDEDDARILLDQLPLVKEGLIAFTLIPLVAYDGFERLFEN